MRNKLLATTAAMLVGMTLALAQNMPNSAAQSERNSAGADRQQQGRDMQRGAQDSRPVAQDKRGQPQQSEDRQRRDQTTGQAQPKERNQSAQGRNKEERGNSAQGQNKESESKQRGETQRDPTTGQGQREQSRKSERGERDQTQGQAPQRQQSQSDQGKGQAQQRSPKQGQPEQSQSQQNQPQAPQGQAQQNRGQPNQAQQGRADGNVTLTSEQRTRIQQTVLAGNNVPRVNTVNFALNVGVAVPTRVRVVEVPPTLIEIYPQWRGHQYFVVHDDIVIVDRSRKIVATLPMASSGGGAQTGSAGDIINLGPDEIRQVQIVLKEKGFYRGEPDGVLGPTTQALIAFQRQQGPASERSHRHPDGHGTRRAEPVRTAGQPEPACYDRPGRQPPGRQYNAAVACQSECGRRAAAFQPECGRRAGRQPERNAIRNHRAGRRRPSAAAGHQAGQR